MEHLLENQIMTQAN